MEPARRLPPAYSTFRNGQPSSEPSLINLKLKSNVLSVACFTSSSAIARSKGVNFASSRAIPSSASSRFAAAPRIASRARAWPDARHVRLSTATRCWLRANAACSSSAALLTTSTARRGHAQLTQTRLDRGGFSLLRSERCTFLRQPAQLLKLGSRCPRAARKSAPCATMDCSVSALRCRLPARAPSSV